MLDEFLEIEVLSGVNIRIPRTHEKVYTQFEKYSIDYIKKYLRQGDICVDVGANFGYYTALLSSLVSARGKVFAFEPAPATYSILESNTKNLKNTEIVPLAVSDKSGVINFYHTNDFVNSGTVPNPPFQSPDEIENIVVDATSLDEYLQAQRYVDFIKIDVQGDDIKALLGAEKIIKRSPDIKVLVEWAPHWMENAGYHLTALPEILQSLGFKKLVALDDWRGRKISVESFMAEIAETDNIRRFCNIFAQK
jgi:FkbM family methyltransferase